MKNNIIKKLAAVFVTAAMIGTRFSLVSAADVSDIEIQSEEVFEVSEEPVIEFAEDIPEEEVTETEPVQEEPEVQPEENQEIQADSSQTVYDEGTGEISGKDVEIIFSDESEELTVPEEPAIKTDFLYENEEVVITAKVSEEAALPENAEIKAEKLMPGDPRYEGAKKASVDSLGTAEDAEYTFYDITFTVDGNEAELPKGAAEIQMKFKNEIPLEESDKQSALHISKTEDGTVAEDVTAESNSDAVSSSGFNFGKGHAKMHGLFLCTKRNPFKTGIRGWKKSHFVL